MKIYLLRHADAENLATSDAARRLTPKGKLQAARVGHFLHSHRIPIEAILHSPYERAAETARIVKQQFATAAFIANPQLGCGMDAESGLAIITSMQKFESILLVGHQPDFGELAACLLSTNQSFSVHFRKASLLCISLEKASPGMGVLEWFLPVQLLDGSL